MNSYFYDRLKYRQTGFDQLLLNKVSGKGTELRKQLLLYPVCRPPYSGFALHLSKSQAEQNFLWFMQEKPNRLSVVRELLAHFGINLDYHSPARHPLMQLDEWAYQQWPCIHRVSLVKSNVYTFEVPERDIAIRSLLFDIGLLLGECFLGLTSETQWFLDNSPVSKVENRPSYHRVVIKLPPKPGQPKGWHDVADMEAQVFFHYALQTKPNPLLVADQKIGRVLAEPVLRLLQETS